MSKIDDGIKRIAVRTRKSLTAATGSRSVRTTRTIATFPRLARSTCLDAGKNLFGFNPAIFLFAEQDSLRGHGDSAEMAAAITKRFANHGEFCLPEPFSKISS